MIQAVLFLIHIHNDIDIFVTVVSLVCPVQWTVSIFIKEPVVCLT